MIVTWTAKPKTFKGRSYKHYMSIIQCPTKSKTKKYFKVNLLVKKEERIKSYCYVNLRLGTFLINFLWNKYLSFK